MAMQQSEEQATRNGIMALEQAYTSIQQRQQDVQTTGENLATGYGGADGGKFKQLLDKWDHNVNTILINLERMVEELNETLKEQGLMQGSASESIDTEYSRAEAVFDELNGSGFRVNT